ncbi:hypothetical protein ACW18Q_02425 [Limosilactobacillus reuteri]
MHVVTPKELEPTKETLDKANEEIAPRLVLRLLLLMTSKKVSKMDVIYADVWVSMGRSDDIGKADKHLKPYQVTMDVMKATENPNVLLNTVFLHSTTSTLKLVRKLKRSLASRK